MSTLDGILVAISAIVSFDLFRNWLAPIIFKNTGQEALNKYAMGASRIIILAMGITAYLLSINPPKFVGVFASIGLYGILAASVGPIVGGLFLKKVNVWTAFIGVNLGLFVHLYLFYSGYSPNTAKTATIATLVNLIFVFGTTLLLPFFSKTNKPA